MLDSFNKRYWEEKYESGQAGWDIGAISTPLQAYIDQLTDKDIEILIPGAGNSYEAEYLFQQGFKNVTIIDIAKQPLDNFRDRTPDFPEKKLIQQDFFEHYKTYDLIIEQTFFCALNPSFREKYVTKIFDLLNNKGKLVGLFFDFKLTDEGPPFGGSLIEYLQLFNNQFKILTFEKCYNSIKPRDGNELFLIAKRN
ncbi:methyltransferase domain-containing protein [Lutibacter sp.]|uniref:methyltransferase domain-containing protein n=1 Tax=Lutibacter sp. TaxID=1925666 RepID=UPI002736DE69|nr:methyltransferase domain-containing protein [Lutibacter sp.]MDP3313214.1 SAM-dependent methyltransferase [Lutibacter sp.]